MKILSIILLVIGFILCGISSLALRYYLWQVINGMMASGTAGIGIVANGFDKMSLLSYVNIFGCVIIFLGIITSIVSLFTGRKQQTT